MKPIASNGQVAASVKHVQIRAVALSYRDEKETMAKERDMRTAVLLVASALLGGCAASGERSDTPGPQAGKPLQLWSHHKSLDVPVEICGEKGFNVLTALGFSNVVRNGNYSYGNFDESRAAVKCVEMPKGSFVYFAVASAEKQRAEELRNRISQKF